MPKRDLEYDPTEGETTFRGVILPATCLAVGLIIRLAFAFFRSSSAGEHIGLMICQVILSVVVMLIACVSAAMMMSVNFGPIDRAALKLRAVSLCAGAIGTILAATGPRTHIGPNMSIVAWYAVVGCYLLFFLLFFSGQLGIQETLLTVCIVVVMQLAVSFALANLLKIGQPLALFFSQ